MTAYPERGVRSARRSFTFKIGGRIKNFGIFEIAKRRKDIGKKPDAIYNGCLILVLDSHSWVNNDVALIRRQFARGKFHHKK